jgi:tetratricopeptide (TPR) repeat protein
MANSKPKLSACLIVKDEEANLTRCLRSLEGVADEIIVVDTGSTDGTLALAKKLGAKTACVEWNDDFGAARNASLSHATGDWVLIIDADEELTAAAVKAIVKAISTKKADAYELPIRNFTEAEGNTEALVHSTIRLFRRVEGLEFRGKVHERISDSIKEKGFKVQALDAAILHHGYRPGERAAQKLAARLAALEVEVRSNPNDALLWFHLANAYYTDARYPEAAFASKRAISKLTGGEPFAEFAFTVFVSASVIENRMDVALAACEEAETKGCSGPHLLFERACLLVRMGRTCEAFDVADQACNWTKPCAIWDESTLNTKRFLLRGRLHALNGRVEEALCDFDSIRGSAQDQTELDLARAGALEIGGRFEEAQQIYAGLKETLSIALLGWARTSMQLRQYEPACEAYSGVWHADTTNFDAWVGWVACCEALGRTDEVLRAYEAFSNACEPTPEVLVNWGRVLEAGGNIDRALSCFSEAIKLEPNNSNAYFNFGDLLYRCGRYADAAHIYESGLRINPDHADGWFVLGNALAQLGLNSGAATSYRQALNINPLHSGAHYNLEVLTEAA